jgi:hypothetical protein
MIPDPHNRTYRSNHTLTSACEKSVWQFHMIVMHAQHMASSPAVITTGDKSLQQQLAMTLGFLFHCKGFQL